MSERLLELLVINWQDIENPQAGGAEIHLHEIFGRLAARGHSVTLLCSGWSEGQSREEVDGIHVHRVGGRHSFTLAAAPYYRRHLIDFRFDLVVEDINKIPLFSPLWSRAPVVALIPHLFGTTAFQEVSMATAATVWLAEQPLPYVYRDSPFQAISESTAEDLAARGVPRSSVRVIYPGIDHSRFYPDPTVERFSEPTFTYVGRLKRYKSLERVVDAVATLADQGLRPKFVVAGRGDHESELRRYAEAVAGDAVEFRGYISEEEKVELLRRAWAAVYPSPKEGWGITNIEAAACGTPVVASNSPGLRESVASGASGILVRHGDVKGWAAALRRLSEDRPLRQRLSEGAVKFAARFSWDRAAGETEAHLRQIVDNSRGRMRSGLHNSVVGG